MNSGAFEIPDFLTHLPTHHGLPVPFSQAWLNGKPDFRTLDPDKTIHSVLKTLCAICGRRLGERSYFIGGERSKASHLFTDPPMHKDCAEFATQTCPFVSGKKLDYSDRPTNPQTTKVQEMVSTQRPAQMFILSAWTKKTRLARSGDSVLIQAGSWIGEQRI